jgi:Skp family chaperone for outer membrane proteins
MIKALSGAALVALTAALPGAVQAQAIGTAVIATVDTDRVVSECNACRTANAQLQQQLQAAQQFAQQLQGPLQTEATALQAAVRALNGKQPDAALQQRIRTFETNQNNMEQQIAQRQRTLQSTQANVNQQIGSRLGPIINAVMVARGATVAIAKGATLASNPALDITNDVLARLNQQLPSISVTPLPQAAAPAAPAATPRPAAPGR